MTLASIRQRGYCSYSCPVIIIIMVINEVSSTRAVTRTMQEFIKIWQPKAELVH